MLVCMDQILINPLRKNLTNYLSENSILTFGSCSIQEVHSAFRKELNCVKVCSVQEGRTTLK